MPRSVIPGCQFASDNTAPICPEAWEAVERANAGYLPSYGNDPWTTRACDLIREMFGVTVKYRAKIAEAPEVKITAPVIEPTEPEEFTTEEELEEAEVAEAPAPVVAEPEDQERAGEFMLREVLGAEPIKGDD